jgi:hypothetical protein
LTEPNSKGIVLAGLRDRIVPILAKNGFSDFRKVRSARIRADRFEIVQYEFFTAATHREWSTTPFSFGISAGIYLKFVPPLRGEWDDPDLPGDTDCQVRCSLYKSIKQHPKVRNLWILEKDLSNFDSVLADAARMIEEKLIPWFQSLGTTQQLLHLFLEGEERIDGADNTFGFGRKGSPIRNVLTGLTALETKDYGLAEKYLAICADNHWYTAGKQSDVVTERIKSALNEARLALRDHKPL